MGFPAHPIVAHIQADGRMVGVTEREKQVLTLISEGKTANDIGGILNMNPKTVYFHRGNIETKFRTRSVALLTRIALRAGLTTLLLVGALAMAQSSTMLLSWDNPGAQYSNMVYRVYWTANVNAPLASWSLIKTDANPTNISSTRMGTFFPWTNPPGAYFFSAQWSNSFWGNTSFFSAAVATPPVPPTNQAFNPSLQLVP